MLTIKDLVASKELTKSALVAVMGGHHKIGNYSHMHSGAWRLTYRRAFAVRVRRGLLTFRAIQYQYTYKRYQSLYRGKLRITGVAIGRV